MSSTTQPPTLFWRAALSFLLLPGIVAWVIPWYVLRPAERAFHAIALLPLGLGAAMLLWCVRDFHVAGKGTLAPWDPPTELVVVGLYRFSRNPMYVAVLVILVGWVVAYRTWPLALYALVIGIAFHLRVVLGEEPHLARRHGSGWAAYAARVSRWLPGL